MKTIENQQLVETTGGHRFAPVCHPYAPYPYAPPARAYAPAFAYPYGGYGAYAGWYAPPAIAARRGWWW